MIKTALFKVNYLFILFLILILLSIPVSSNQAQVSIFNTGIQLGVAKARFQLFGQNTTERFTLRDLRWAREAIITGETDMAQFAQICETRRNMIGRIIGMIDNYSRSTRNSNANARKTYINNIFESYRSAVAITFDSSREDSCRAQSNCDGQLALAGYKFGQALLASNVQGNRARSFQLGRIGEMRDAIRKGIWLSMDRANRGETMTGILKLCCSFGDHNEWRRFMNALGRSTPQETFRNLMDDIRGTIRRAVVTAADCRAGADWRGDNRREDHRRDDNRQEENLVRGQIRTNITYMMGYNATRAKFHRDGRLVVWGRRSGRGRWSLNPDTNILTMSGIGGRSFSGPVYRLSTGFRVIGQWSDGTRETIDFRAQHLFIIPE